MINGGFRARDENKKVPNFLVLESENVERTLLLLTKKMQRMLLKAYATVLERVIIISLITRLFQFLYLFSHHNNCMLFAWLLRSFCFAGCLESFAMEVCIHENRGTLVIEVIHLQKDKSRDRTPLRSVWTLISTLQYHLSQA